MPANWKGNQSGLGRYSQTGDAQMSAQQGAGRIKTLRASQATLPDRWWGEQRKRGC